VSSNRLEAILICVGLVAITAAIYGQVLDFGFTHFDDQDYVTNNPWVQNGINAVTLKWAFTSLYESNWHPLTWVSLMLDHEINGLDGRVYHATNLALHIANTLLLFALLSLATGRRWPAAVVAALFAVHPLHVESVAWISERKDVLSTLFWMLTTLAYVRYVRSPSVRNYVPVLVFYAMGLMVKPMLVTLPFTLMLLDYWPLSRCGQKGWDLSDSLREKLPLIALALISGYLTFIAQKLGGAVIESETYSISVRLSNAVVTYVNYLWRTVWPAGLACFYPHPKNTLPPLLVVGCTAAIFAATIWAIRSARHRPYLAVGWMWYLITLLPVIGLVQVGKQGSADRYTYVPLIGVFVAVVWWIGDLVADRSRELRAAAAAVATVILLAFMAVAWRQTGYWSDDLTLFGRCVAVTSNNEVAEYNYATSLLAAGRKSEAIKHFKASIAADPRKSNAHGNLGVIYLRDNRLKLAAREFRAAIRHCPNDALAYVYLGETLERMGDLDAAVKHYRKALKINPGFEPAVRHLEEAGILDEP